MSSYRTGGEFKLFSKDNTVDTILSNSYAEEIINALF